MKRMQMEVVNYYEFTATGAKNGDVQQRCRLSFDKTDSVAVFSPNEKIGAKKLSILQQWAGANDMLGLLDKPFMVVIQDGQIYAIGNENDQFIKVNGDDCRTYTISEL